MPRPPAAGIRRSRASESRCSSSERRRGTYSCSSSRSPRPSPSAHSRSEERKSPTKRATTSRPDSASAVRNGRGSRLPKNEPVCVIRKRSPRRYSSPAKSSKSEPFAIVVTGPRGEKPRASSAIASLTATTASALRATSFAIWRSPCSLMRTGRLSARRCGCATSESRRSATHLTPVAFFAAAPTRCTEDGGEVVSTTSMPSCRTIRIEDATSRIANAARTSATINGAIQFSSGWLVPYSAWMQGGVQGALGGASARSAGWGSPGQE